MKKLFLKLILILLFISSSSTLFAAIANSPSIVINGYLPGEESIFQIKHDNNELNLSTGILLLKENTNFTDRLRTSMFYIYMTNNTDAKLTYKLNLRTEGFRKVNYDSDGTTIISLGAILNQINLTEVFGRVYPYVSGSSSYRISGTKLQSVYGVTYNLELDPYSNSDSEVRVFYFLFQWNSALPENPVPAGDYMATVVIENITQ